MTDSPQPPRGLGGLRDPHDPRDFAARPVLRLEAQTARVEIPPSKSIASKMPPIYDQGNLGACAPHAAAGCYEYEGEQGGFSRTATPSRLQVYREARILMYPPWEFEDSGSSIRTCIKALAKGACPEMLWRYEDKEQSDKWMKPPADACVEVSQLHQAINYYRLDESSPETLLNEIKLSLSLGHPVAFGIVLYESFRPDPKTGTIPAPKPGEREWGGHAMTIVGFDFRQGRRLLLVRNSWGTGWGGMQRTVFGIPVGRKLKGYAWLDADWVCKEGWDFWQIRTVEG